MSNPEAKIEVRWGVEVVAVGDKELEVIDLCMTAIAVLPTDNERRRVVRYIALRMNVAAP